MERFCITRQPGPAGRHEVHKANCPAAPPPPGQLDLGYWRDCYSAVAEARQYVDNVTGCLRCIPCCHRD